MRTIFRQQAVADLLLGRTPTHRRHVILVVSSLVPYAVTIGVMLHAVHLGILDAKIGWWLSGLSAFLFLIFYTLVRSGWSQHRPDPVMGFQHSACSITLCMAGYLALGNHRADTTILIAQTIVLAMLRVRPKEVLVLGVYAVTLLLACTVGLTWHDPGQYPARSSVAHFLVAGPSLLTLSLICKWISDLRLRMTQQARELSEAIGTLEQMATHDMLTGVINRRVMTELAETELKLVERHGTPVCMALLDVDHFKQVNDVHGHQVGDLVLKALAQHAKTHLRHVDKLARWGGEEFLLMLPAIPLPEAMAALERVRHDIASLRFPERPGLTVTFSAGLAMAKPGESLERLIERADMALYEAKRQGRNRCVLALDQTLSALEGGPSRQALAS
jgi:diguanylate cyclase (GGDEF)-like protein